MATLVNRRIGTIELDAVVEETHQSDLSLTENPIESSALVADHAVLEPQVITVAGVVVDYQPQSSPEPAGNDSLLNQLGTLVDRADLPSALANFTPQTLVRAQRELSSYIDKAAVLQSQVQSATRAIADWLPDFVPVSTSDSSGSDGRVEQIYEELRKLQRSGEKFEVQTGAKLYENMLIISLAARQTKDGSIELVITLRELFTVETKSISGVSLPAKKQGRTGAQGASKSQKGTTNPKDAEPVKNQSLLKRMGGLFQ